MKYLSGLVTALIQGGVQIFAHTPVERVEDSQPVRVITKAGHTVECAAAVIATNSPINNVVAIHSKQAPYRTYAIGSRIPKGTVPLALYWDTEEPYHYVRTYIDADGHGSLIVGGEDHKTGQASDAALRFARLELWARER